ncbi:MAG: DUF2304 domain-containing protein [Streptococcaceae bacterium]|jgi:hypothetical protein|nr:DUF2304 domain-containing protein [Streptococcaceae bacterium]
MSLQLTLLAVLISGYFLWYVIRLTRKNKAEVGQVRKWILLAAMMVVGAIFSTPLAQTARFIGFKTYVSFVLFFLLIAVLLIVFRINLALIVGERKTKTLIQELSILKREVEELEEKVSEMENKKSQDSW